MIDKLKQTFIHAPALFDNKKKGRFMEAKKYLNQVHKIDMLIENKLIEKAHWRNIATCTSSSNESERVQSSSDQQKMANAVCRIADIETEIDGLVDSLVDIKQEIIKTIETLDDELYDILHKKYIQGKELWEIADIKNRPLATIKRKHGKALKQVQDIIDKREEDENRAD